MQQNGPGRPKGRKYVIGKRLMLTEAQLDEIRVFAKQAGEGQSEYIRTAIAQRNKREARRRPLTEKMRELK